MISLVRGFVDAVHKRIAPEHFARRLGVKMGKRCRLIKVDFSTEPYLVTLGDHVSATATRFETHDGGVWVLRDEAPEIDLVRPIRVGSNVFIGYGSIILPGVTIGDNVVIGAGSVVARDIPSNYVAAGVPARIIRPIDEYKAKMRLVGQPTKYMAVDKKRAYYFEYFGCS
jgi:acetyltransferase-like isoleucine patch superfamily enzyme